MSETRPRTSGPRIWIAIAIALPVMYVGGYGAARTSKALVRYESGCISRGDRRYWDRLENCNDLRMLDAADGRATAWQIAFAPLIFIEECLRPGYQPPPPRLVETAVGPAQLYPLGDGGCVRLPLADVDGGQFDARVVPCSSMR